ncbi:hypothetical protein VIGAN_11133100, partial [Vigna angularis var. angularis]
NFTLWPFEKGVLHYWKKGDIQQIEVQLAGEERVASSIFQLSRSHLESFTRPAWMKATPRPMRGKNAQQHTRQIQQQPPKGEENLNVKGAGFVGH